MRSSPRPASGSAPCRSAIMIFMPRCTALAAALAAGLAAAEDPPGALSCSGCHGSDATFPRITGRDPAEIVSLLAGFRDGIQPATLMDRIARGLTPAESQAIADWLGAQK